MLAVGLGRRPFLQLPEGAAYSISNKLRPPASSPWRHLFELGRHFIIEFDYDLPHIPQYMDDPIDNQDPLGDRLWMRPNPVTAWTEPLDGTPPCPQHQNRGALPTGPIIGNEDSLL